MLTKEQQEKTKIKIAKDEQELRAKLKAKAEFESMCKLGTYAIVAIVFIVLEVIQFISGFNIGSIAVFIIIFMTYFIVNIFIRSIIKEPDINIQQSPNKIKNER